MIKSDSIVNLTRALIIAKKAFTPVLREKENPGFKRDGKFSKYADLSTVIDATEPSLLENGLLIIQYPHSTVTPNGIAVGVTTLLTHASGEFVQDSFDLPLGKQDAQAGVGGVTYARRTGLKAVLTIAEEDDDGNTASRVPEPLKAVSAPKQTTTAVKVEPAGPPKANNPFPNETPKTGSDTSKTSDSTLPTAEELDGYRKRFGKLVDALSTNGLKSSKGLPLQKKVLAYLLQQTGAPAAEKVSKANWETFFSNVSAITNETSITKVVELINQSLDENKKESVA